MLDQVKKVVAAAKEPLEALAAGVLNDEQKKVAVDLISIARAMAKYKDIRDQVDGYTIGHELKDTLIHLIEADPEIGGDSVKKIEDLVLRSMILGKINGEVISKEKERVDKKLERKALLDDPDFKVAVQAMVTLARELRGLEAKDIYKKLEPLGPKDVTYGEDKWGSVFQSMANKGSEFIKDDYDMDKAAKLWQKMPESDRATFVDRATDIISKWVAEEEKNNSKLKEKNPPEGGPDDPLNQYAFADQRRGKVPREINNDEEQRLYKVIKAHFANNDPMTIKDANAIAEILKAGKYANIFREPQQKWIFRGMSVPESYIRKALKMKPGEKLPNDGSKVAWFTFTPKENRGATSWAITPDGAKNFTGSGGGSYRLIMVASTTRNPNKFVLGPGGLYDVPGFDAYPDEEEAVGLGDIKVSKIFWTKGYAGWKGLPKATGPGKKGKATKGKSLDSHGPKKKPATKTTTKKAPPKKAPVKKPVPKKPAPKKPTKKPVKKY